MLPVLMWRSVKKPIVWGPLLGVVLSAIGIKMPDLLLASIKPLGLAATAAALFLTGVILSARKLQLNALIATSTIVKLLVQPFIAWGLVMLLGLHGSIAITAILMIALAAGFFGVVFGNRFGVQSPDAEAVLLLSSVLCILYATAVYLFDFRTVNHVSNAASPRSSLVKPRQRLGRYCRAVGGSAVASRAAGGGEARR